MEAKVEHMHIDERTFTADKAFKEQANIRDKTLFDLAGNNFCAYWKEEACKLHWFKPWDTVLEWQPPHATWFLGGKTNISYNCLDRHIPKLADKIALYWEDEQGEKKTYTYAQLLDAVQRCANVLKELGIEKGDRVALYMPMTPEAIITMQACARIGAIQTVVFGGFSPQALAERMQDATCKLLVTSNGSYRKGQLLKIKERADQAVVQCPTVEHVLVVRNIDEACPMTAERDVWYHESMQHADPVCLPVATDAQDPLFILYTSGTTGKPKGIVHTVGGYMVGAYATTKYVFDVKDADIFWCTADVGWITGHTYVAYGPLLNGMTQLIYEGALHYPHKARIWELIQNYKVTTLYTAPTAIRMFSTWSHAIPHAYDMSSLRLLGSVGEPLNPEAWMWYYEHIGNNKCPIVDTWWQTETGSIMITSLPSIEVMKPGYAGKPLPGIAAALVDEQGNRVETGTGLLTITKPWPSMMHTIWQDDARYTSAYFKPPCYDVYYTGDAATRDKDGNYMILGRVDDVINVSGHRLGTAEIESALVDYHAAAEAAVVPRPHAITGQEIVAFVMLKENTQPTDALKKELQQHVVDLIGGIARPAHIVFVPDLPKTRSGKIMRRLLKNIVEGLPLGDTATLANPEMLPIIQQAYREAVEQKEH